MCGRVTLITNAEELAEFFGITRILVSHLPARYNIAPTQPIAAVIQNKSNERTLEHFTWGLIPSWSKDTSIGAKLINARGETIAEKPSFRNAFKRRRCIVPASGFYEWKKIGKGKQPFYIRPRGERFFGMAGLWETWNGPNGEQINSCSIVTTAANDMMRALHERMPVILDGNDFGAWVDVTGEDTAAAQALIKAFPAGRMEMRAVSSRVNSVANDDAGCLATAEISEAPRTAPTLFD